MRTLADIALAENERRALEAAAATLRERFPVTDLVLFGSKARGDSDPDSDLDLLVLTERPLDHREEEEVGHALFDIGLGFDVVFGALTVDGRPWREGVHSVLPIHAEVEREGVRCLDRAAEAPASPGDPPPASREVLVKKVVDEWMQMAEASTRAYRRRCIATSYIPAC